jgi:hypothetical protein
VILPVFIRITRPVRSVIYNIATQKFIYGKKETKFQVLQAGIGTPIQYVHQESGFQIPKTFVWAILIGVTLISIIPASGIFWLFFRQENGLYQNTDQMIMAKEIDQRARVINQSISDFKYNTADITDKSFICRQKFSSGIYMISGQSFADSTGTKMLRWFTRQMNTYNCTISFPRRQPGPELDRHHRCSRGQVMGLCKPTGEHNSGPELRINRRTASIPMVSGSLRIPPHPEYRRTHRSFLFRYGRAFSIFHCGPMF